MGRNGSFDDESPVPRYVAATRCRNFIIPSSNCFRIASLRSPLHLPYYLAWDTWVCGTTVSPLSPMWWVALKFTRHTLVDGHAVPRDSGPKSKQNSKTTEPIRLPDPPEGTFPSPVLPDSVKRALVRFSACHTTK